ncbi:hypothetical protein L7F22_060952 [Adiantum nelumboides]|nr:hypothetical protein [Adiantum nelumboides]
MVDSSERLILVLVGSMLILLTFMKLFWKPIVRYYCRRRRPLEPTGLPEEGYVYMEVLVEEAMEYIRAQLQASRRPPSAEEIEAAVPSSLFKLHKTNDPSSIKPAGCIIKCLQDLQSSAAVAGGQSSYPADCSICMDDLQSAGDLPNSAPAECRVGVQDLRTGALLTDPSSILADCSICLEDLREGERVRRLPACGHTFHARCIDLWFADFASSCPCCRATVSLPTSTPPPSERAAAYSQPDR